MSSQSLTDRLADYINTGKGDAKSLITRSLWRIDALERTLKDLGEKAEQAHNYTAQVIREADAAQ
jgi:hypothetical protein